jgi:hypothetical protein
VVMLAYLIELDGDVRGPMHEKFEEYGRPSAALNLVAPPSTWSIISGAGDLASMITTPWARHWRLSSRVTARRCRQPQRQIAQRVFIRSAHLAAAIDILPSSPSFSPFR